MSDRHLVDWGGRGESKNMCLWNDQLSIISTDFTLTVECCHKRLVWLCKLAIWQINNLSSLARLHLISLLITSWLLFPYPPATSQHFLHCPRYPLRLCRKCVVYFPRRLRAHGNQHHQHFHTKSAFHLCFRIVVPPLLLDQSKPLTCR